MATADEDKSVKVQVIYLHGDLDLKIVAARRLPNMDVLVNNFRRCVTVCGSCTTPPSKSRSADSASDLEGDGAGEKKVHSHRKIITTDPYVTVVVPQATVARTRVLKNSQNPRWNEHFVIPLAHPVVDLEFQVKDDDVFGAELVGTVKIPASDLLTGDLISDWFSIIGANGQPPKPDTALRLEMRFTPCEKNPLYRHGIPGDPDQLGVRHTYFPLRKGCQLTLYQDAHVTPGLFPEIKLENNQVYKQGTCWEDICHAISEAHHLVYIVGWSVFHKIKLIREPTRELPRGGDLTLGELLKYKSEEGVRILLLVWDDKTSHDKFGIKTGGVMQTHDEETLKFFKHSTVNCVLAPRYGSSKLGIFKQQVVGTMFTHHQKCVLVDTQASGNNRKITAFMGGIDLCDGRYDTPEHRLFRDLNTVFEGDFHNPTYPATTKAPRQPWHDLHCRIDGPAAYDILINFEQRWRRSTRWKEFSLKFKKVSHWHDDSLIKIERISWILSPELSVKSDGTTIVPTDDRVVRVSNENNPENWHIQIFRSIDSGSLKGFPKHINEIEAQNLLCSKDLVIDKSIQEAYIQAIRSAQHYIYIENQYFLGSSYAWPSYKFAGADNLIPMELALKIANKIRANERFAVYVIIPMWPEGDPKTNTVQEILFWQSQTMQMMYSVVAQALKDMQMSSHPQEYLNFYCLGNREEIPKDASATNGAMVSDSQKYERFMIYVHAKGMIVDDEYVIVGSANINQRSMAGTKDTEIAMGAYQPHHTWIKKNKHPYGQVYGYRKSLWAEHLGKLDRCFEEPESSECVKTVNQIANENWKRFTASEFTLLQGHLLKYPLDIDANGKVGPLQGHENFPDTGGSVIGIHAMSLPDTLTT
ncbi:hypothetical protein Dsin_011438 [Dipteronia sinensis]|uniref:Phospholipase D n=1 Tax=Dipteronia sinensis TaxID=43782 RepID=A0AAE0AUC8_9ROSI|nr:hypothetical protein Dsin_011438 [Dipteronia sinensis]